MARCCATIVGENISGGIVFHQVLFVIISVTLNFNMYISCMTNGD